MLYFRWIIILGFITLSIYLSLSNLEYYSKFHSKELEQLDEEFVKSEESEIIKNLYIFIEELKLKDNFFGEDIVAFQEILDNYIENRQLNSSFIDYMAATYACKAAVKAGDKLDDNECISLVDKLFSTKHPYYCPHGRPIIINLSMNDLDKRFERI